MILPVCGIGARMKRVVPQFLLQKALTRNIRPAILRKISRRTLTSGSDTAMYQTIRVSNFFYFYFWGYDPEGKRCA